MKIVTIDRNNRSGEKFTIFGIVVFGLGQSASFIQVLSISHMLPLVRVKN